MEDRDSESADGAPPVTPAGQPLEAEPVGDPPVLEYATPGAENLVTLRTFHDSLEANLALSMLRSHGIECVLGDENINAIGGGLYDVLTGGVKLKVFGRDLERAQALLPRSRSDRARCPTCGGRDTHEIKWPAWGRMLSLLLLGFPALFLSKSWTCTRCRKKFARDPEDDGTDDDDARAPAGR
jgi:DNA-directed RNA polymerase subunit RPC12/RpoP